MQFAGKMQYSRITTTSVSWKSKQNKKPQALEVRNNEEVI